MLSMRGAGKKIWRPEVPTASHADFRAALAGINIRSENGCSIRARLICVNQVGAEIRARQFSLNFAHV
jgi:hypothetical protein